MKFSSTLAVGVWALLVLSIWETSAAAEPAIRIQGSPVVSRVLKAAVPALREVGIEIKILEDCGSTQAAALLGAGEIDVALMTRDLTGEERAAYPEMRMEDNQIGTQVVAILISRTMWESGVRALTKQQVADLYENRIKNWKELGGEERPIKFFEMAHGRGIWEMFANWLYGEARKAPAVKWETVAQGSDARDSVSFNSGGVSIASLQWADGKEVFALGTREEGGPAITPTMANIAAGKYPLARPVIAVFANKPTGNKKKLLEFLLGEKGQALVSKNELLSLAEVKKP